MQGRLPYRLTPSCIKDMEPIDVLFWANYEKWVGQDDDSLTLLKLLIRKEGI